MGLSIQGNDYGAQGAFAWGGFTGILGAALGANSEIFQFRWVSPSVLAVVRRVRISACVSTTFFAAGVPVQVDMAKATAWSAQGTGGTGVSMGTTAKRRTLLASSVLGDNDMRIATTAALGAGTKTLEANSLSTLAVTGPTAGDGTIIPPGTAIWEAHVGSGELPLILGTNEGFVIRSVAVPATGTWTASVRVEWAEVASY